MSGHGFELRLLDLFLGEDSSVKSMVPGIVDSLRVCAWEGTTHCGVTMSVHE